MALIADRPPAQEPTVRAAEPDLGVIEVARRRSRARRMRMTAVTTGALALFGAILWVGGNDGPGTTPAHDAATARPTTASFDPTSARPLQVRLSPVLTGGETGWCVVAPGGGSCGATQSSSTPLFVTDGSFSARHRFGEAISLTTPNVAAVLVDGHRRVATEAVPGLPYGLRAVRVLTPAQPDPARPGTYLPPRHEPRLLALEANGRPIHQADPIPHSDARIRSWQRPQAPLSGPCALRSAGLPGLAARWGHLAATIAPYPGRIVGRAFLSCVDTEYFLKGASIDAAILLDASHPGVTPAAIPGLHAVAEAAGLFEGPGGFQGPLTAKRIPAGWLVVAARGGATLRRAVIRHLRTTVELGRLG